MYLRSNYNQWQSKDETPPLAAKCLATRFCFLFPRIYSTVSQNIFTKRVVFIWPW